MLIKPVFWMLGLLWHLWRIATFRPAFARISDKAAPVLVLAACHLAAGLGLWWSQLGFDGMIVGTVLLGKTLLHLMVFDSFNRSSSLMACSFGSSALASLVGLVYAALGVPPMLVGLLVGCHEVLWTTMAIVLFADLPDPVRRSGYDASDFHDDALIGAHA